MNISHKINNVDIDDDLNCALDIDILDIPNGNMLKNMKNKIGIIKKIITDSVKETISREFINPITEESVFLNNPPFIISEGLIKTYPIDRSISSFAKIYNIKVVNNRQEAYEIITTEALDNDFKGVIFKENSLNNTERILIIMGDSEYNKNIIEHYLDKFGYILSNEEDYKQGWKIFVFEKKFDNDATEIVQDIGELYHICKMSIKDKILAKGIVPKSSQWKSFNNGPRCYFFLPLSNEQIEKWVMNFRLRKKQYSETYMLLKINVNNLPKTQKFYLDPRMKNAVYSLEGIPPYAIKIVRENINGMMI